MFVQNGLMVMCLQRISFRFMQNLINPPHTSVCRYVNLIQYHKQIANVFTSDLPSVLQCGSCFSIPYQCPLQTGIC